MSIQFNPFERRWELFVDSSPEDRLQWIKEAYPNYLMPINSETDVDLSERRLRPVSYTHLTLPTSDLV